MAKMRLLILIGVLLLIFPNFAYAEPADTFSGLSFSIGGDLSRDLSTADNRFSYVNLFAGAPDAENSDIVSVNPENEIDVVPFAKFGYTFALSKKFLLGFSASFDLAKTNKILQSERYFFANPNNRTDFIVDYRVTTKIKSQFHWSVAVEPGYMFTENMAGFLKLSYHQMNADIISQTTVDTSNLPSSPSIVDTRHQRNFSGVGAGVSLKFLVSSFFIEPSAEWTQFFSKQVLGPSLVRVPSELFLTQSHRVSPSWFRFGVSVGYKF
ncbi:hypothetical protein UZ36_07200 [Candidatus Nitromaritima sp. SCGC AAA799-C22]|nr:hypothetical protein UZ36_07200 [Candidatus Nitromaritima sp. SCGC AAA799-C22]